MSPREPPRRATLRLLDGHGATRPQILDRPIFQIGRAAESCGLVLDDRAVAPQHCCLRRQGARWWLLDRGSPTGTYVNNRRCREPTTLHDGDRISIGLHLLEFRTAPALTLEHTLARLGGIGLEFTTSLPPARPDPRAHHPLRAVCLAAATAFAVTLSVAADVRPEPHTLFDSPIPKDISQPSRPRMPAPPAPEDISQPSQPRTPATPVPEDTSQPSQPRMSGAPVPRDISPTNRSAPPTDRTEYLAEPPAFELPANAVTRGRPDAGTVLHALQLPASPDYLIRCPAHAFASAAAASELMQALATFRNRSGYQGEIVVGDLSQDGGGRYGPHRSHQSGRDVDLWLPILGGEYRRGCLRCGTDLCRPEPAEVDWKTTWQLVQAFASRDSAQDIFLAWELQPALREAARALGTPESELARRIQHPTRGRSTLVKHAEAHTHHLHIRFRCPPDDHHCIARP